MYYNFNKVYLSLKISCTLCAIVNAVKGIRKSVLLKYKTKPIYLCANKLYKLNLNIVK